MSTAAVHSILQQIAVLSEGEKRALQAELAQHLSSNGQAAGSPKSLCLDPQDAAAMRWLDEHRDQYSGQWIVLDGDRLLAHGAELKTVAQQARAGGVAYPLWHFVEPEAPYPYIRS